MTNLVDFRTRQSRLLEELEQIKAGLNIQQKLLPLRERLESTLRELYEYYDGIADFVEDCAHARGHKVGKQADLAVLSWARRQLEEYRVMTKMRG